MSLYSWKQLARWSIDYSCLDKKQQIEAHGYLNDAWEIFCADVIKTYGSIMKGEVVDPDKAKQLYSELKAARVEVEKATEKRQKEELAA